jgi:TIR domain-containing protein
MNMVVFPHSAPVTNMPFDKDLFISYTHIDNEPLMEGQKGWVDRFHFSLGSVLSRRLGSKARIWKDEKLAGNDDFADEIVAQFPKTAVMISVVSPRYIQSPWCTKEVGKFCEVAEQTIGIKVNNKYRLFRIALGPVSREKLPHPIMEKALGFDFYEVGSDQTPREYDPIFGTEWEQKFLATMQRLAWELSCTLKLLEEAEAAPNVSATEQPETADAVSSKPTVYLAECSYDQRPAREALDVELKRHGYLVLPDSELPKEEDAYIAQVAECLEQSQLSIHLIGSSYGMVPDGPSEKSIVVLQNELAIQQSRTKGLKRLIWIPEGLVPKQEEQVHFIDLLQKDDDAQFGADVITSREQEAIKGAMHAALQKLQEKPPAAAPKTDGDERKMIFLICDEKDLMNTIPLNKLLKSHGFDVTIPVFEGDAAVVRQTRVDLLAQASGVLVFYGEGSPSWKASIDAELRKHSSGQGEKAIFTCLAAPETVAKKYLIATEEANVLNGLPGITEDAVKPFLAAVNGVQS